MLRPHRFIGHHSGFGPLKRTYDSSRDTQSILHDEPDPPQWQEHDEFLCVCCSRWSGGAIISSITGDDPSEQLSRALAWLSLWRFSHSSGCVKSPATLEANNLSPKKNPSEHGELELHVLDFDCQVSLARSPPPPWWSHHVVACSDHG